MQQEQNDLDVLIDVPPEAPQQKEEIMDTGKKPPNNEEIIQDSRRLQSVYTENKLLQNSRSSSSSEDDPYRQELLWTSRQERLIIDWQQDAEIKSLAHQTKAKFLRSLHRIFGTTSVITPIVFTMVVNLFPTNTYISSSGLMTCSLFSAIIGLFAFNQQSGDNFEASQKYNSLVQDIRSELSKPKRQRVACDMFMCRIELLLQQLSLTSPHL